MAISLATRQAALRSQIARHAGPNAIVDCSLKAHIGSVLDVGETLGSRRYPSNRTLSHPTVPLGPRTDSAGYVLCDWELKLPPGVGGEDFRLLRAPHRHRMKGAAHGPVSGKQCKR